MKEKTKMSMSFFMYFPTNTICRVKSSDEERVMKSPSRISPAPFPAMSPMPERARKPPAKAFAGGRFFRTAQLTKGASAT